MWFESAWYRPVAQSTQDELPTYFPLEHAKRQTSVDVPDVPRGAVRPEGQDRLRVSVDVSRRLTDRELEAQRRGRRAGAEGVLRRTTGPESLACGSTCLPSRS